MSGDTILAINAGSSSLKFALYRCDTSAFESAAAAGDPDTACEAGGHFGADPDSAILRGAIEGLEPRGQPRMHWQRRGREATTPRALPPGDGDSFARALHHLRTSLANEDGIAPPVAVAHRIVHGGQRYGDSILLDHAVLAYLATLIPLAPLHQPHNLAGVRACMHAWPHLPQAGCFDTGFHATLAADEYLYALPELLPEYGVRRYGFHGLSYRYLSSRLRALSTRSAGRVLMAHLGNGASVCAMLGWRSIATSMGYSTLDGLVMGTRSGALDPGILLQLLRQGWSRQRIEDLLYRGSGLLGVSGLSADMRTLRASAAPAAQLAIALFEHRLLRECGAMSACLGGLDLLAFTGGIGEHDAALRQATCERLRYLGVAIDPAANRQADGSAARAIHAAGSNVEIWVVPTDEGRVAASDAASLLAAQSRLRGDAA